MFKKLLFQAHWLFGITAGLVLAVVGVTGATLSFEPQILRALNPGVVTVAPGPDKPLTPAELLARVRADHPGRRVNSLTVSADPGDAARVVLAAPRVPGAKPGDAKPGGAKPGPGGKRGETFYLHPATGATLGPARGEAFLHFMEDVHRRLAADDAGKRVVGASVLILLVLALSGLYLRWPRRPQDWRAWFLLHPARRGRSFLWDLHSVIGTWVLPFYLMAALTGLFWSYEWYRDGLYALSGVPKPPPAGEARAAGPGGAKASGGAGNPDGPGRVAGGRPEAGGREDAARGAGRPDPAVDLAGVWSAFRREVPVYQSATLRLPDQPGKPVQIQYLDPDPGPYRPFNKLSLDPADFSVQSHERYADKPLNARLMASILALHSGGYFGLVGLTLMMLASLLMPLFAITGWLLYLDRRGKQRAVRAARAAVAGGKPGPGTPGGGLAAPGGGPAAPGERPAAPGGSPAPGGEWLVGFASQAGFAERLAWQTAGALRAAGVPVSVRPLAGLHPDGLKDYRNALFVVSTFGDGQPPDAARGFARRLLAEAGPSKEAPLRGLRFGLLALGDREYGTFCGFGRALDAGLRRHGARPLFDPVEVDRDDPGSLRAWRARLAGLGLAADDAAGDTDTDRAWAAPAFQPWRLAARRLLNPGSIGGPTYHVELEPPAGEGPATWSSGDVVEIRPRHPAARVAAFLAAHGLDSAARVRAADLAPGAQSESVTAGPAQANAGGRGCAGAEPAGVWRPLADALSGLELPPLRPAPGPDESPGKSSGELPSDASPQAWVDALRPLKTRDYSIASLPADGRIHLLIRQERHATPGGADELGVASGWLTQHAPLGAEVELRIRPNRSFHLTPGAAPAVFVGNGTGLAGLRAHLKARVAAGHGRNWLVFGERQAAHDYYYREEIEAWRAQGLIERLDLAFSREPATTGEYVQHRLLAAAGGVRAWVAAGATIYVCGSLAGMAGGVEAALEEILGAGAVERLSAEGRYRRDVY